MLHWSILRYGKKITPYPINKSATIEVIQNRIVEHELGEGKSSNR